MRNHIQLADAYYRLSDEERKYGESASITNQRTIVREYCEKHGIILVEEFVDDGFSGGNFERPGFQAMLEHLKTGKANMVITKDLSRLGRDMTESSHYAERYFPEHGIRYLAPGSNFDSEEDNLMAPFQFAMNDVYLRDTSRKVKQTLNTKRNNGKYVACPPYGYRKRDDDSKRLVPDEETKGVVQRIFKLCAEGKGPNQIARILRDDHVLNPTNQYYQQTGVACTRLDTTRPYNWCGATVANILSNPVYLGHTLNMQRSTLSYKNKQIFHRPPEEQVLVKNTHEAIIDQESWDTVQRVREHKRRPPKHMDVPGLFAGLVYCGGYMVLCRTGKMKPEQYYFRCSTYGKRGKDACTAHHITEANLNAIVLDDLRRVTHFARTKKHQFAAYINRKNTAQLRKEMTATQRELDKMVKRNSDLSVLFKRLYEDNVLGKISNEQFRMLSADYNTEQKQLAAAIPEKQAKLEKLKASAANVDAFIEKASRYTEISELTPELLWTFIERIDIGERPGRYNRNGMQEVRIIYRDIGVVDSAMSAEDAESAEVHFIPSLEMVVQQMAAQTQVS